MQTVPPYIFINNEEYWYISEVQDARYIQNDNLNLHLQSHISV